jgi:hypothetical protein
MAATGGDGTSGQQMMTAAAHGESTMAVKNTTMAAALDEDDW